MKRKILGCFIIFCVFEILCGLFVSAKVTLWVNPILFLHYLVKVSVVALAAIGGIVLIGHLACWGISLLVEEDV